MRRHLRFLPQPSSLQEGGRGGNLGAPSWRHSTEHPTCASSGNSQARLGLAPPGSAVSTNPAGPSSAGNHPSPRAVSFLLRCRPSRDPRLRGAGCPMEGGLSSGRGQAPFPNPRKGWNGVPTLPVAALWLLARENNGGAYLRVS